MEEKIDFDKAKELWNSPSPHISRAQMDAAYGHISGFVAKSRVHRGLRYGAVGLAAALLLVTVWLTGAFFGTSNDRMQPEYVEYLAATGQTRKITLADGSLVHLNAQSSLCATVSMDGPTRDVILCGEGYFEVAKDPERPFIVHAGGTRVKVTGTKFNVRAYLDEGESTTTLLEGGVEVSVPGQTNPITLTPGKALRVGAGDIYLYDTDPSNAAGWHKGEFNAYHKTLNQICRDLERRFGVKIMISDEKIADKMFYASFVNNEGVDQILAALNVQKDFRIRKQDKFYSIY